MVDDKTKEIVRSQITKGLTTGQGLVFSALHRNVCIMVNLDFSVEDGRSQLTF